MNEYLVIGSGLSGAVIARELAEHGNKVTILEKRVDEIGGNLYDYMIDGIRIHKYGPHIWHTNSKSIHEWMDRFANFIDYEHKVQALHNNLYYKFPPDPNKWTPEEIVDIFYRPYTEKMWDKKLEDVSPDILDRVRTQSNVYNDMYFPNDKYQGMPENGWTETISKMIDHKNINIIFTKFDKSFNTKRYKKIFNSMSPDEYYSYKYGALGYRGLLFWTAKIPLYDLNIPTPTINFTANKEDLPYTRMTEWKKYPGCGDNKFCTYITYEEPIAALSPISEKFYPINAEDDKKILKKYKKLQKTEKNMIFIGRQGTYKYIDMDDAIKLALKIVKKEINEND